MPRPKKNLGTHPELGLPEVRKLWQTEGLFSDHYLKARLQNNSWWPSDAEAEPIWRFCKELYEKRYLACAKNNEAFTRQELLDKILEKLGFAWTDNLSLPDQDAEPDYILFSSAEEKEKVIEAGKQQRYAASVGILEAKKVNHPLSQISKHQQRYPHQQIRDYLNEAQVLTWSILTNGNEWRLYTRDAKPSQFFGLNFEIAIKSLADFKVFLVLFSAAAFARDAQGKCRLDQIREVALATQAELEADLRARIFTVVEILANGFAERPENNITDADLPRLYENCLIYLYRLLFILYAEGRLLLPVEQRADVKAGKDNSFANEILKLNICDPAMGSGHFLVEATIYLADHIVYHPTTKFQAEFSKGESQEQAEIAGWRRRVVEACIYGVDLNPLAVELAKLSLWLTTISSDKPLNFLDHHLRCGNSLIGARLDQLGSLPQKKGRLEDRQIHFTFGPDFKRVVAETLGQINEIESQASSDVAQVKAKEKRWEIEVLPRLASYKKVADLWVNAFFDGPLSEEEYLAAAKEILVVAKEGADRLQEAAARYQPEKPYFHWELEFPEVFFGEDGSRKDNAGFDAVVGNPPWGAKMSQEEKEFFRLLETDTSTPNTYIYFIRQGELLTRRKWFAGFIVPDSILVKDYAQTRRVLLQENTLTRIVYLERAFKGVNHDSTIIIFSRGIISELELQVGIVPRNKTAIEKFVSPIQRDIFNNPELEFRFNLNLNASNAKLYRRLSQFPKVGDVGEFHEGIHTGNIRDKLFHRTKPSYSMPEKVKPCLIGSSYGDEFGRYFCIPNRNWIIYDPSLIGKDTGEYASLRDENIFLGEKLYVTRTGDDFYSFFDDCHYASNNLFSFKINPKNANISCRYVQTILNSKFAQRYNRLYLAPRFGDLFTETKIIHLALVPLPPIEFSTPESGRKRLITKARALYESSLPTKAEAILDFAEKELAANHADVIHDFLAYLAGQMTDLNKDKQTTAKSFLTDLKEFYGIEVRSLTPKTKLDEFWKLETADLFAHLHANKIKIKESDEEKIRSRFLKGKAKLVPLDSQINFTDTLIDQIVYRLYGLTEDEIKIVGGTGK